MKSVRQFFFSMHRICGFLISLLFLMWFITGLVLIYHPFPNVTQQQLNEKKEVLAGSFPDIEACLASVAIHPEEVRSVRLRSFQGQPQFTVQTKDKTETFCADTTQRPEPVTFGVIEQIAKQWVDAPVAKIDTLHDRDQWIMYTRYLDEMPIYKFRYADADKHQLYIASRTGQVQQFTTRTSRLWGWAGAIPHKLYFPFIRKHTELWVNILTALGVLALITSLTGIYVGIYAFYKRYKTRKILESPYKKGCYRRHHIIGIVFGFFLAGWAFSGAMAMQRIPQWIIKTHGEYRTGSSKFRGKKLPLSAYQLDYRDLIAACPDIKEIEWSHFRDIPVYNIIAGDATYSIDASGKHPEKLFLPAEQIEKAVHALHETDMYQLTLINEYEEYYLSRKGIAPLPVYKVTVDNADESLYYIEPETGDFKYLNRSRKAKKWIFSALHYFQIKWLVERPLLWTICIWTTCLGGALVSLTGVWLGIGYFRRKIK